MSKPIPWIALWLSAFPGVAQQPPVTIHVDAARELHRLTPRFIGVNVEDLNFQG